MVSSNGITCNVFFDYESLSCFMSPYLFTVWRIARRATSCCIVVKLHIVSTKFIKPGKRFVGTA